MSASKYAFRHAERFAVWEAFEGKCFWCAKPLEFVHTTIDHIVPESTNDESLTSIRTEYGLGMGFVINDYCNWVPCHSVCNSKKGTWLVGPSPAMVAILRDVARRAEVARDIGQRVLSDRQRGKILGQLTTAVEAKLVRREDIDLLFKDLPPPPATGSLPDAQRFIDNRWTVLREDKYLRVVTDGRMVGVQSKDPNDRVRCGVCGSNGPWNGARCLNCGTMQDDD